MARIGEAGEVMQMEPLPIVARALLRVAGPAARERAAADLHVLHERIARVRGRSAARSACVRESFFIVMWSAFDAVRRRNEEEGSVRTGPPVPWRRRMFPDFMRDLRHGARSLARRPGFTAVSVLVLGLGIGATTTIFTLANRLFLEPPSGVVRPDELVTVFRASGPFISGSVGYPDYVDYRAAANSLEGLAAAASGSSAVTARIGAGSTQVRVRPVSDNWFDLLGVRPAAGRWFRADENETQDTHPVAVLSWHYWTERMGGDPSAVGSEFLLNGHSFTVVGIAPRGFAGLTPSAQAPDLYVPIMMLNAVSPQSDTAWRLRDPDSSENWLEIVGRLRADATVERVQSELAAVAAQNYPASADRPGETVHVSSDYRWRPSLRNSLVNLTRLLLITVVGLLAVAAANLAILLLARASARVREIGIRSAIGAGRRHVLRQLLAESLLIGVAGAVVGLVLSLIASGSAAALLPVPLELPAWPDLRVLLFVTVISVGTALIVGSIPALRLAKLDAAGMILGRPGIGGGRRLRDGLVVVQIALSLVLTAGAALFARSLRTAREVDIGFDSHNALLVRVNLSARGYDAERGRPFLEEALTRIRALPGVSVATATRQVPFQGDWTTTIRPWSGATFPSGASELEVGLNVVADDYFDAMSIPIREGRAIGTQDDAGTQPAVVVNETFARLALPGGPVAGRTLPLRGADAPPFVIVGVAADARYYAFSEDPRPQAYLPIRQSFATTFSFLVKTPGSPTALAQPVQDLLHAMDADLAFPRIETLETVYMQQLSSYRTSATVVGVTGIIALLLSSAGLFGVMAHRVTERTREIGVRMALGASRRVVAGDILASGVRLTLVGVIIGIAGALLAGRFVEGLLFGVEARDPASLTIAPVVLFVSAIAALLVPARRAMVVDPMTAMRAD